MKKPIRQIFKEYFNFLGKDRNAVIALCVLIAVVMAGHLVVNRIELKSQYDLTEVMEAFKAWESEQEDQQEIAAYFEFDPNTITAESLDSLPIPRFIRRNILRYRSAGGTFSQPGDFRKIYGMNDSIFAELEPYIRISSEKQNYDEKAKPIEFEMPTGFFDPNTATTDELQQFGFNQFQASNVVKYRQSGGFFTQPSDLLKIYGIDSAFFMRVQRIIQIEEQPEVEILSGSFRERAPVVVELNSADSLDLVKLRGIGPVFASRILKYRDLLGGFYSPYQLLEVYGFPEETFQALSQNLMADSLKVEKLRLNFAGYTELVRHPYFERDQVQAILNFRNANGPFSSNAQLVSEGLLDSAKYAALKPYLSCR
ncbi:MAG TPA: hypothetical protein ENN90_05965 [Mariniphaga anaerophila]|uniref:Helix-hairpin-helix domain-containing protein n=1 Tax=Mariniphaga anaerophila TaxID=1484053 RepID=A0A831PK35_9BACT|nr:hypothetical protein [Mariniphaga anaerophila]